MSVRSEPLMRVPVELAVGDGSLQLARDAFDSSTLGIEIGRVTTAQAASLSSYQELYSRLGDEVDELGYDQVIRRVGVNDRDESIALERTGFELVDVGLTFARSDVGIEPDAVPPRFSIREASEDDVVALERELVRERWGSRFEVDRAYDRDRVSELKRRWLWNSFEARADAFLVGVEGTAVAGFITCIEEKRRTGTIELVGTVPAYRRRGVASLLVRQALAWFAGRTDVVRVRCQASNRAATSLYQRVGFLLEDTDLTFRLSVRPPRSSRAAPEASWTASS